MEEKFVEYDKAKIKALTLIEVLTAYGIPYQIRSNRIFFLCPSHGDKHIGSCYSKKFSERNPNNWKCESCGAGGDVISIAAAKCNISLPDGFQEALKELSERFNIPPISGEALPPTIPVRASKLSYKEYEILMHPVFKVRSIEKETEFLCYDYKEEYALTMKELFKESPELHDELLIRGFYKALKYQCIASMLLPQDVKGEALAESIKALYKLLKKGLYNKLLFEKIKKEKAPAA